MKDAFERVIGVVDENGADITYLYIIDTSLLGRLVIDPIKITVTAGSKTVVYDPSNVSAVTCTEYMIDDPTKLVSGHRVVVTLWGSISSPGSCVNSVESIKIYDSYGNDVTGCYEIVTVDGVIVITPP